MQSFRNVLPIPLFFHYSQMFKTQMKLLPKTKPKNWHTINLPYSILILCLCLFYSCDISYLTKEVELTELEGEIYVPLGEVRHSIVDLLNAFSIDSYQVDSGDQSLFFSYQQSFSTKEFNSIFDLTIPNTAIDISVLAENVSYNKTITEFLPIEKEITQMYLRSGILSIELEGQSNLDLTIEIPSLLDKVNGSPFRKTIQYPEESSFTINLKRFNADLTHNGDRYVELTNSLVLHINGEFNSIEDHTLSSD